MERAKRRHIQKCVKECSAEQIMNRLFKIFWDTVKEGHDPTAFSQKAWVRVLRTQLLVGTAVVLKFLKRRMRPRAFSAVRKRE